MEQRYASNCEKFEVNRFPTSEGTYTICNLATWLGQEVYNTLHCIHTCQGYAKNQIAHGFPDPILDSLPRLYQILQGAKVVTGLPDCSKHFCFPITPSILWRWSRRFWQSYVVDSSNNYIATFISLSETKRFKSRPPICLEGVDHPHRGHNSLKL